MLVDAYKWHRAHPVGAQEVGKAAVIALMAARAEAVARKRGWRFEWVYDWDEKEWSVLCFDECDHVIGAIGGWDDTQQHGEFERAIFAAVAVSVLWDEITEVFDAEV